VGLPVNVEWLRSITPLTVLKWGAVAFLYAIAILFVINVVIATFDAWL
jgi:hypothetical protein